MWIQKFSEESVQHSAHKWNNICADLFVSLEGSSIVFLYGIVCTFGALANLVVLFAFIRTANLRNLRNSFIVNLACSDLLLCVVTAPVTLYTSANLFWPFGNISCKVLASLQAVNTFVSSLTLALIAMDRVLLTKYPVKWRLAPTASIICYCIVWIISIVVALPYSLTVKSQKFDRAEPWNDVHTPAMVNRAHNSAFSTIFQYLLPLCALAYAYVQIGSTIRRRSKVSRTIDQARRMSMQSRNRRALLLLMILVLTYAICWAPMNIHNALNSFEVISYSQYRYLFCHLVGISSACVNPITYALVNESFRNALHHMFLSFRPCYVTSGESASSYITNTKLQKVTVSFHLFIYSFILPNSPIFPSILVCV
uniref:G_PROTEIN_RECEP_F1_2 domain-containing protein n=1 Tax=Angiostrongylus cantonensis TaxID=6313 RepID=A0A158PAX0_ANGCA